MRFKIHCSCSLMYCGEIQIFQKFKSQKFLTYPVPWLACSKLTMSLVNQTLHFANAKQIQSTLVISKSKGPSETLRDI